MKIVTASNGKKTVKMSKIEWIEIGKKAEWMKESQNLPSDRPTGKVVDRSLEALPSIIQQLQQQIHGVLDPNIKQSLNTIIGRPLSDLLGKIQEYKSQKVGFK